jgi:CRISPR-associated protein (TIGR02584 family)
MKNILLAVVGLSPQVITETLFALHQQGRKVDAVHIITTRQGKEQINAHLLSPKDGRYYQYLRDYELDHRLIDFGFDNIHTIKDPHGIEIDDITGEEENEWLLKCSLEWTFRLTRDTNSSVFFSIAGGRKTMSACLMVAAQFYGRPQDRVFHVLVTPEFESNRNFYYPPRISSPVELRDSQGEPYIKETKYASVTLVPIPFVSIRDQLSDNMLSRPKDPATLLLSLIREEPYQLIVDLTTARLIYKKRELDIMPTRLALYAYFALLKKECKKESPSCRGCTDCYQSIYDVMDQHDKVAELYRKLSGNRDFFAMSDKGILSLGKENFNSYRSKIRKDIERGFGIYALREIAIASVGARPDTRYGLRIDRKRIRVIL